MPPRSSSPPSAADARRADRLSRGTAATCPGGSPGASPAGLPGADGATDGTVVEAFGTGLAETVIMLRADAVLWQRRPGADVQDDGACRARAVPRGFARRAAAASSARFTFALPVITGTFWTWTAPGRSSAARLLTAPAAPAGARRIPDVLQLLGEHLRAFHSLGGLPFSRGCSPLPYASRLAAWMGTGSGPRAAPAWHAILLRGLGHSRWARLAHYTREALAVRAPATAVIGWATLGSVILPDTGGAGPALPPALLCGEHGGVAAPETDIGCLLGELYDIESALARRGSPAEHVSACRAALLEGYGADFDAGRAARAATVRVAAHAHDFAAFAGFSCDLYAYVGLLADLLDTEGAPTLGTGGGRAS